MKLFETGEGLSERTLVCVVYRDRMEAENCERIKSDPRIVIEYLIIQAGC